MTKNIESIEQFHQFIQTHRLVVIHVMRNHCSVCHAVLPQIEDIVNDYSKVHFAVINQSNVEAIAGELSIFTVPSGFNIFGRKRNASTSAFYRYARF